MFLKAMLNARSVVLVVTLLTVTNLPLYSANEFVVTESPSATGGIDFSVQNNRDVPLTGFTVKFVYHPARGSDAATLIYDSLANGPSQPALKQGESYTWHLIVTKNSSDVQPPDYSVNAAIFADGLAIGDPAAIQSLWKRREWAAIGWQQVFQDLDSSVPDIENTQEAISILKHLQDQQLPPGTPREQRHGVVTYGTVIAGLELVVNRRARGENESAAARIAALHKWAAERVAEIESQVRPVQVSETQVVSPLQVSH